MNSKKWLDVINISMVGLCLLFIFLGFNGIINANRTDDVTLHEVLKTIYYVGFMIIGCIGLSIQVLIYNLKNLKK